jgi:hypothetical protein
MKQLSQLEIEAVAGGDFILPPLPTPPGPPTPDPVYPNPIWHQDV